MKYTFVILFLVLACFAQDQPPHRSAITPPPIPNAQPFLRPIKNCSLIVIPPGKLTTDMFSLATMPVEELLERVRTNKNNLYLIELRDAPKRQMTVTDEEETLLRNFRQGQPQQP
jgi:hypothetical protein